MLPPLLLHATTIAFIALLYLFLWQVGKAIRSHLKGEEGRRQSRSLAVIQSPTQLGLAFPVTGPVILGRSPEADVCLDDPYSSDFHVRLSLQAGQIRLHDLGSTNGTFVNGERVVAPLTLQPGDRLQIGQTIMEVR